MRNKKGFTLVELLAVIVILGIILLIAVPKIIDVIDNAKLSSIKSTVKLVGAQAETEYSTREALGTLDQVNDKIECSDVSDISSNSYSACDIEFTEGIATVTISGTGRFTGYECTGTSISVSCTIDDVPEVLNTNLNNVRYIKDCINGSSVNGGNHWVEIQAIDNETNVALNKTVTGTVTYSTTSGGYSYTAITNGNIISSDYAASSIVDLQCVTVDLEQEYNLDSITVWHYYDDGRTYYSNTTYVSSDNGNWTAVIANEDAETSAGKTVSAYEESGIVTPIYRMTNLVTNGSFEDGSNGWNELNGTISTAEANIGTHSVYVNDDSEGVSYWSYSDDIPIIVGHKYYIFSSVYVVSFDNAYSCGAYGLYLRASTSDKSTNVGSMKAGLVSSVTTGFEKYGFIFSSNYTNMVVGPGTWRSGISTVYYDAVGTIDLTATFGSDNEPSQEWCDANIDYFDGTQTFYLNT